MIVQRTAVGTGHVWNIEPCLTARLVFLWHVGRFRAGCSPGLPQQETR